MKNSVINCFELTKKFGKFTALQDVSLALAQGEILAILGPSGSGKTTLLRVIAGFERVEHGKIKMFGNTVLDESIFVNPEQRNVGMVFQEYALFPHLTVEENIKFGILNLNKSDMESTYDKVLNLVRLQDLGARYPHELSGGQQQRVALARTIAPGPNAVLLDEPFSNLDAEMRREMRVEVQNIFREGEISAIFVTHDRDEAFGMADRIAIMNSGMIEQIDRPDIIYNNPSTRFVAELATGCDFLPATLDESRAKTEIGKFEYEIQGNVLPPDGTLDLMVHPSDFRVSRNPSGDCSVLSRDFHGGVMFITVILPSGIRLRCVEYSQSGLVSGDRVSVIPAREAPFLGFSRD